MTTDLPPLAPPETEAADAARPVLEELSGWLDLQGYDFVPPTPATHDRVVGRASRQVARNIRDIFGWSLPFAPGLLPERMFDRLRQADLLGEAGPDLHRSRIRVARVHGHLFIHSAYPTTRADSVFLGPDSYRFADFIRRQMGQLGAGARIVDYGAGAGVGGIVASAAAPGSQLLLADTNPSALMLSAINAKIAGCDARGVRVESPRDVEGSFDLIVTHPPFLMDSNKRTYRDGGDLYGARLSLDWTLALAEKLAPEGRFIMHTGVAMVDGADVLRERLEQDLPKGQYHLSYTELDPDIFGDELDNEPYADVERIAAVGVVVRRA